MSQVGATQVGVTHVGVTHVKKQHNIQSEIIRETASGHTSPDMRELSAEYEPSPTAEKERSSLNV